MGAWDTGVFDDDTSCDIIEKVIQSDIPLSKLVKKAILISGQEQLNTKHCHLIIVAAAMTNTLLNGVKYDGISDMDEWLNKQDKDSISPFRNSLIKALHRVISDGSDLNNLWLESKPHYQSWKQNIERIIHELTPIAKDKAPDSKRKIDFSNKTTKELVSLERTIDPNLTPDSYQALQHELEKRSAEVTEYKETATNLHQERTNLKIKLVAILQLLGGPALAGVAIYKGLDIVSISGLLIGLLALLSVSSGFFLLKQHSIGYLLTYINQALQLPMVIFGGVTYQYSAIGGIFLTFSNLGSIGLNAAINPYFRVNFIDVGDMYLFGIDLFAVFIMILITTTREMDEKPTGKAT